MNQEYVQAGNSTIHALQSAWQQLQQQQPRLRIRDAAARLGVSEAELVACSASTLRLQNEWGRIIEAMPALDRVMCLTRNASSVHERYGRFEHVDVHGRMGLVTGPDIDLRLFLRNWTYGFAATQQLASGVRKSLQFFDAAGDAVFKVYAIDATNTDAWQALIERFTDADQTPQLNISSAQTNGTATGEAEAGESVLDIDRLRRDWREMRTTHHFAGLLRRHKLDRRRALHSVGHDFARPLPLQAGSALLEFAARSGQPIMVFVGNSGCVQIHSGPVSALKRTGDWFNVLDDDFNLHLRESDVAEVWLVTKPTEDGDINSVELYDGRGELTAQFFGARKPGIPEREDWRELLRSLFGNVETPQRQAS